MKFVVNRPALSAALALVAKAAPVTSARPILGNVLLVADPSDGSDFAPAVSVYATNLTVSVKHKIKSAEIEYGGSVLVPAAKFREIIREAQDDTLSVRLENDRIVIDGNDSRFKLNTHAVDDFPPEPSVGEGGSVEVPTNIVLAAINKARFAASSHPIDSLVMDGVLINITKKKLEVVATDGQRLAISWTEAFSDAKGSLIIPKSAMALVAQMPSSDAPMKVSWSDNRVTFSTENITISSVLIEGQFPPYSKILPGDPRVTAKLNRQAFVQSLRRAALFAEGSSSGLRMEWVGGRGVRMETVDPAEGEGCVNHPCEVKGGDIQIGFRPAVLREGLEHADCDEVTLEMTEPNRPAIVRGQNYLYMAMPINIEAAPEEAAAESQE